MKQIIVASRGRSGKNGGWIQRLEPNLDGLVNTITSVAKDNLVLEIKNENKTSNKKRMD